MMTVKDLMLALSKYPEDKEVFLSTDEEGNSYHQLVDISKLGDIEDTLILWPGGAEKDVTFDDDELVDMSTLGDVEKE